MESNSFEIEKEDTTLVFTVNRNKSTDDVEINMRRIDKEGKLHFNSTQMFLTAEEFKKLTYFFTDIQNKVTLYNQFYEDEYQTKLL